jgi:hypothetical protein
MGIERARVIEVRAGTGYQVDGRLVLTSAGVVGRSESVDVRPSGSGTWVPATVVWRGDAALLEVSDPAALLPSPRPLRWGAVVGSRPVAVAALGFPPVDGGPRWARDPEQWSGRLSADGTVRADAAAMAGAALFAGAELVGVLDGVSRAVSVAAMAADDAFVDLVGGLEVVPVETQATGFPVLP